MFSQEFDREKAYSILRTPEYDVLVVKLESLSSVGPEALSEFTGQTIQELVNANIGSNKTSADLQRSLKGAFKITEEEADQIYDTPQVKFFYTSEEIESFKKRWTARP